MTETIIVGAIIVAAAGYTIYRLFFKPSCGCGSDCACDSGKKNGHGKSCGKDGGCSCGK